MNRGGRGGAWIVMFSEVTLFVYSVSTILLLIVATKPTVTKAWPLFSPNDNALLLITTVALTLMLVKGNLAFSGSPAFYSFRIRFTCSWISSKQTQQLKLIDNGIVVSFFVELLSPSRLIRILVLRTLIRQKSCIYSFR